MKAAAVAEEARIEALDNGRVRLCGAVTFHSVPALWPRLAQAVTTAGVTTLDLAGVERADSAAVALMLECLRAARAAGGGVRFVAVPAQVLAIARVAGVEKILSLDIEAAPAPAAASPGCGAPPAAETRQG